MLRFLQTCIGESLANIRRNARSSVAAAAAAFCAVVRRERGREGERERRGGSFWPSSKVTSRRRLSFLLSIQGNFLLLLSLSVCAPGGACVRPWEQQPTEEEAPSPLSLKAAHTRPPLLFLTLFASLVKGGIQPGPLGQSSILSKQKKETRRFLQGKLSGFLGGSVLL